MLHTNEKQILNIIKYTPPLFITIISLIIIILLYIDKQNNLKNEKFIYKTQYIKKNKEILKNDIDNLNEFITKTQEETEEKLKKYLKDRVYEANNIAMRIYKENKDNKSKDEIKKMIKDALVDIRFNNNRGYYFIYSFDYECILLPVARNLEGTNFYNFKDEKGTYLTRNIIEQLKKDKEGFMTWWFHKPSDLKSQYKKLGFNLYFEPLDWFIGTGEYILDFEKDIKEEVLSYIAKLNNKENDHYFVLDYNKNILFHLDKTFINKKYYDIDFFNDGENIVNDIDKLAKSGEGFLSYIPNKSYLEKSASSKILYIKGIDNWQWSIGKIFYEEDINILLKDKEKELNNKFNQNLKNIIIIAVIFTIILLLISAYISKIIEKKLLRYRRSLDKSIEVKEKQQHIISQQSKMAAMGEMLGSIAHQWRQPLSLISTISSGIKIQIELNELDTKELNSSLDNITQTAIYLSKTIDDFRNFYRIDKKEEYFNIKESFEKTTQLINAQLKNNNISLILDLQDFEIYGLENEFIQALINILNNSKDALDEIKDEKFIFIKSYEKENKYFIEIKDNALGVKEELIDRICEPYFTTKLDNKGTGIGLYMTNEIITKHMHGKITLENNEFVYKDINYKGLLAVIEFPKNSK